MASSTARVKPTWQITWRSISLRQLATTNRMLNYIQEQFTLALELAYQIYSIVKQFVSSYAVFLCCISPKRCSGTLAFPLGQQVKPQYILQDGPAIAFGGLQLHA